MLLERCQLLFWFQKQQTSLIAGLRKTNEQAVDMSGEKDKEKSDTEAQVTLRFMYCCRKFRLLINN